MSARDSEPTGVATAEPPQPPGAPPATGTATPDPNRKPTRGCGCAIAAAIVLALLIAMAALGAYFILGQPAKVTPAEKVRTPEVQSAFSSAMKKAKVSAPQAPTTPIEITTVKPIGKHLFEATFSYEELTALLAAFSHASKSAQKAGASVTSVERADDGDIRVSGQFSMSGMSYTGAIEGPAKYSGGKIAADGKVSATMNGFPVPGSQAEQAATLLIRYLNGYLAAAPGLKVDSAEIAEGGIRVTGSAPDTISW
jgi:hypothetical protein